MTSTTDDLGAAAGTTRRPPAPAAATAPAPAATASAGPAEPERRVRLHGVTADGVLTLAGSAAGALGLVWVLYERLLPVSGALGFWLAWYVVFLGLYATCAGLQWGARAVSDRLASVALSTAGLLLLVLVVDEIGYLVFRGHAALGHGNLFTDTMVLAGPLDGLDRGGLLHAVVGSLEQLGLATALTVPLGILAALFLVEIGGPLARPVRTIVDAMSALPSIVAGLFVLATLILGLGVGMSGFAASLAISVMMMPIVTRAAEAVIRLVPGTLREAGYALGASQWRTVWTVVLPTARPGLATAVVLAMARGVGETSPVLLTAGFTKSMNADPFSGQQANLPLYIWNYVRYPQDTMVARAFAAGVTLMSVVLVLFVTARMLGGRTPGQLSHRQRRRIARDAAR
ncbi:phosphate ABC transporter permease PstA [Peterkaempfera sp. SMS 1(5)a]|uniref:phosphate ABC transporter permease PstA n=1 Tax=Peterkaempfera podocarpi TaxID=3232308 RepID=UPI003671667F